MTADHRCEDQRTGRGCRCVQVSPGVAASAARYKVCRATLARWIAAGRCRCCEGPLGTAWCVDHCHRSGFARGVVCRRCNIALAYLEDEPFLTRALRYLGSPLAVVDGLRVAAWSAPDVAHVVSPRRCSVVTVGGHQCATSVLRFSPDDVCSTHATDDQRARHASLRDEWRRACEAAFLDFVAVKMAVNADSDGST